MRKCLEIFLFASLLAGYGMPLWAQEGVIRDTLKASVIEDSRIRRIVGVQVVGSDQIRNQVSPMGESDYIKFIQTLPGVSTGADGTSSIYVRGGNLGGNVVTLDGVPVYGTSHLLGFTTVLSNDVVETTEFQVVGRGQPDGIPYPPAFGRWRHASVARLRQREQLHAQRPGQWAHRQGPRFGGRSRAVFSVGPRVRSHRQDGAGNQRPVDTRL